MSMPASTFSRRQCLALLAASFLPGLRAGEPAKLDLVIDAKSFGAGEADIRAVLVSAAGEIWKHCAATKFEFGFRVYRNSKYPITHFEREDGRIVIGLATEKTYWAQYAFQFAHEFCHALMNHATDWRRCWQETEEANQWFEETLCETGSLFALRAMGKAWETNPPYKHWASFGKSLTSYAQERLDNPKHQLPRGKLSRNGLRRRSPCSAGNGRAKTTR